MNKLIAAPTLLAVLGLTACAVYDPAQPGRHRAPGEARADLICGYETPAGSKVQAWRCIKREDKQAQAETAQREADALRMPRPDIKY